MKTLMLSLVIVLATGGSLLAQNAFSGSYAGQYEGAPAAASLQNQNGQLRGSFDYNGTRYTLQGQAQGQEAAGSAVAANEEWTFQAVETGNRLDINFSSWGGVLVIPFSLQKQGATTTRPTTNAQQPSASSSASDARLVGTWLKSSMINSGSGSNFASFTTETLMVFRADGTFEYGASRSVGGGGDWSYGNGGWSAPEVTGTYRSDGSRIFVLTANGQSIPKDQQLMGGYYIDGNNMSTTPANGKKEYWQRR